MHFFKQKPRTHARCTGLKKKTFIKLLINYFKRLVFNYYNQNARLVDMNFFTI